MNIKVALGATIIAISLVGCISTQEMAQAQHNTPRCDQQLRLMIKATKTKDNKLMISASREYLSYCKDSMRAGEYEDTLAGLATGLNGDNQHEEALAVSNRCLQLAPTKLDCIAEKAESLFALGRLRETKSTIENSLALPSITQLDDAAKRLLRNLLTHVNAALKTQSPKPR